MAVITGTYIPHSAAITGVGFILGSSNQEWGEALLFSRKYRDLWIWEMFSNDPAADCIVCTELQVKMWPLSCKTQIEFVLCNRFLFSLPVNANPAQPQALSSDNTSLRSVVHGGCQEDQWYRRGDCSEVMWCWSRVMVYIPLESLPGEVLLRQDEGRLCTLWGPHYMSEPAWWAWCCLAYLMLINHITHR